MSPSVHDLTGPVPPWQIVKEKRATFAATPAAGCTAAAGADRVGQPVPGRRLDRHRPAGDHRRRPALGRQPRLARAAQLGIVRGHEPARTTSLDGLEGAIDRAAQALLRAAARRTATGCSSWKPTPPSRRNTSCCVHYLGEPDDLELERKIGVYLRRIQGDAWRLAAVPRRRLRHQRDGEGLFRAQDDRRRPDAPHMARAREAILAPRRRRAGQCLHPHPAGAVRRAPLGATCRPCRSS